MRKFTSLCIDNETIKQMILSEVSYNNACYYLFSNGFVDPVNTITSGDITTLIFKNPKEINFYYDEKRSYLLSD